MNSEEVEKDISKLIGIELDSIHPGAKITVTDVDVEKGSLMLITASGKKRSRSLYEIKKIWDQMMVSPAVHVEGVLHGSGTSRNQPETILASLPYVEWLRVDNKKHISFVEKNTHPYGTLKRMDAIASSEVIEKMRRTMVKDKSEISSVIVAKEINNSIENIQEVCKGAVSTIDQGVYQLQTQTDLIVFLSADIFDLEEGTYCVIETSSPINSSDRIELCGKYYSVLCKGSIKALVKSEE